MQDERVWAVFSNAGKAERWIARHPDGYDMTAMPLPYDPVEVWK